MSYIDSQKDSSESVDQSWTYLTNHSHVLVCVWRNPQLTAREISNLVGITERSVQRIIRELTADGVLKVEKDGRKNRYQVDPTRMLRHPLENHCSVADLLRLVVQVEDTPSA